MYSELAWNVDEGRFSETSVQLARLYSFTSQNASIQSVILYYPFKACWLRDAPTSLTFNNYTLCPHCIYVFCIYLRTNSDLCHLQHKLIGFYNRDKKCLLRGTDWVFK